MENLRKLIHYPVAIKYTTKAGFKRELYLTSESSGIEIAGCDVSIVDCETPINLALESNDLELMSLESFEDKLLETFVLIKNKLK